MTIRKRPAAAALLAGLLTACSAPSDLTPAQSAIATFHQEMNAGDDTAIYAGLSPDTKETESQAMLTNLVGGVHAKMGNFQSGAVSSWKDSVNNGVHSVQVQFASTFDKGPVQETFDYRIDGNTAQLTDYKVDAGAMSDY
jgi:hypothetical protein